MLGKFGKISDSKLKPSRIGLEGKKKGKEIPGSGEITFVKPGSVKAMCEKGELEFLGNTIKMRQKGQQVKEFVYIFFCHNLACVYNCTFVIFHF